MIARRSRASTVVRWQFSDGSFPMAHKISRLQPLILAAMGSASLRRGKRILRFLHEK
jgi:hypothetical protein